MNTNMLEDMLRIKKDEAAKIAQIKAQAMERILAASDMPDGGIIEGSDLTNSQLFYALEPSANYSVVNNLTICVYSKNVTHAASFTPEEEDRCEDAVIDGIPSVLVEDTVCIGVVLYDIDIPFPYDLMGEELSATGVNSTEMVVPRDRVGEVIEALRQPAVVEALKN